MADKPKIVDAKFEVINGPKPKRKWWQGWRFQFDWQRGLIIGLLSALAAAAAARH